MPFTRFVAQILALVAFVMLLIVIGAVIVGLLHQPDERMEAFNQGQALKEAGQYEQAIPFYREALELGEREFGPNHPTTASLLNNLALLYLDQGRYETAEPLFKRSLGIYESMGPDHTNTAFLLNNLAMLYENQGRYEEAETLFKRSLVIFENALGPDHPDVAMGLENYATLLRKTGREDEAMELEGRAKAKSNKIDSNGTDEAGMTVDPNTVGIFVVVFVVLIAAWYFRRRCPECKHFSVFYATGTERKGQDYLGNEILGTTQDEWLCKSCGHREWKKPFREWRNRGVHQRW